MAKQKVYKLLDNPDDTQENPLTRDRLMEWLASTGWVEGHVRRKISPLDRAYLDDYIQEVWEQILLVPPDKILEIYRRGKGKFVNYIKSIIMNNIYSNSSRLYRNIRAGQESIVHLDDVGWRHFEADEDSHTTLHFPVIQRDNDLDSRVKFEYETIPISSENKLSEYDRDLEEI